jgi:murein DD-endopeptidase MepM/ murein hydrolase activator NlpD
VGNRVRAAAPGIVAYADDTVRGYGNLLILVHGNGWVTIYAHNSKLHVTAGQRVRAGQLVAEVGSTGISRGPHVHFELIHHGKNCDPISLFRPAVLHRNGDASEVTQARWDTDEGRPHEVQCAHRRLHPNSARRGRRGGASEASPDPDFDYEGRGRSSAPHATATPATPPTAPTVL